jgi:hypothetical protein
MDLWRTLVVVLAIAPAGCGSLLGIEELTLDDVPDDATGSTPNESARLVPVICTSGTEGDPTCPFNRLDLGSLGVNGSLDFVAQQLGGGLYLTRMQFTVGAGGMFIEHPLLISHPPGSLEPVVDSLDRFFDVTLNLPPGALMTLGGGTAAFVNFQADPISVAFVAIGPQRPE